MDEFSTSVPLQNCTSFSAPALSLLPSSPQDAQEDLRTSTAQDQRGLACIERRAALKREDTPQGGFVPDFSETVPYSQGQLGAPSGKWSQCRRSTDLILANAYLAQEAASQGLPPPPLRTLKNTKEGREYHGTNIKVSPQLILASSVGGIGRLIEEMSDHLNTGWPLLATVDRASEQRRVNPHSLRKDEGYHRIAFIPPKIDPLTGQEHPLLPLRDKRGVLYFPGVIDNAASDAQALSASLVFYHKGNQLVAGYFKDGQVKPYYPKGSGRAPEWPGAGKEPYVLWYVKKVLPAHGKFPPQPQRLSA